ncbi:MAG: 30S ribosomal protein S6, partial [Hyphomicrobium sp.]
GGFRGGDRDRGGGGGYRGGDREGSTFRPRPPRDGDRPPREGDRAPRPPREGGTSGSGSEE